MLLHIFVTIFLLSNSRIYCDYACPTSWTIYNNSFCHKVVVTPATSFQAQQICISLGGYLADPTDFDELNAIVNGVVKNAWSVPQWGPQWTWV